MTAPAFVTAQQVRDYISLDADATSRYSDSTLGSNIRAASNFLERRTNRWLWDRTATVTLTTNGKPTVGIPGLRTATSVAQAGATLTVDSGYWLIPDAMQTGLYTAIQLRGYDTGRSYLGNPEWFDRNLDHAYWASGNRSSLPNDLVITGDWGFVAGTEPEELLHACKALASYFTKRPDSLLSGGLATEEGSLFDMTEIPVEVRAFVRDWSIAPMVGS